VEGEGRVDERAALPAIKEAEDSEEETIVSQKPEK